MPALIDRNNYDSWKTNGKTTLFDRANAQVKEILETHQPEALDQNLIKELNKLADKENSKGAR